MRGGRQPELLASHPIHRIVFFPLGSCFSFQEPDFLVPSGDTHEARAGVHIEVPEVVPFDLQAYNVVFVSTARIMPSTRKQRSWLQGEAAPVPSTPSDFERVVARLNVTGAVRKFGPTSAMGGEALAAEVCPGVAAQNVGT